MAKKKLCSRCGSYFVPATPCQKYCCEHCKKRAAAFRRRSAAHSEEDEEHAREWRKRWEQGEERTVCLNCLKMWWSKKQYDFCSLGCWAIYNNKEISNGNTQDLPDLP